MITHEQQKHETQNIEGEKQKKNRIKKTSPSDGNAQLYKCFKSSSNMRKSEYIVVLPINKR